MTDNPYAGPAKITSVLEHRGVVVMEDIVFPSLEFLTSNVPTEMKVEPVQPITSRYGGRLIEFRGFEQIFSVHGPIGERKIQNFSIWFPVRDRRVARRISRDTGRKFRMINGVAVFRDDKRCTSA